MRVCPATSASRNAKEKQPSAWDLLRKHRAKQAKVTSPESKERVVHFPKDHCLGRLMVQDEGAVRKIETFHYWVDGTEWEYLGIAMGDVTVPAGKRLALSVSQSGWKYLSALSKLQPDDLYMLDIPGPYPSGPMPDDRCMPHITKLRGLRVLKFGNTNISDRGLKYLGNLSSLERLSLSKQLTNDGLTNVAQLSSLKALYLGEHRLTNAGLVYLAQLDSLEELALGSGRLTDTGLAHLAMLPSLKYLLLRGKNFSDAGMVHLKNIPSLRILNLSHLPHLTNAALVHLSDFADLERLSLHWVEGITDEGIVHLKKMRSLKKLDIAHAKITDKGLAHLAEIKSLEYLHLPNFGLTDKGLPHVAKLDKLKYLWVCGSSNSPITDAGLKEVAKLQRLEELLIAGTGITDEGAAELAKLHNLKELNLSVFNNNFTNRGVAKFIALRSLEKLSIHASGAKITISGLSCLNDMPNLVELRLNGIIQDNSGLNISRLTKLEKLTLGLRRRRVGKSLVFDDVRDEDLACLANLKSLKWVQGIRGVSDNGVKHLRGLTNMERLNVGGPRLTDEGLQCLANMKKLNYLSISDGDFTNKGLRHIEGLKALRYLNITQLMPSATRLYDSYAKVYPTYIPLR